MDIEELRQKVIDSSPDYDFGEKYPNTFGKYGIMICGRLYLLNEDNALQDEDLCERSINWKDLW